MPDIRTIAESIRATGSLGAGIAAIATRLPLPPILKAAAMIRPHAISALCGGLHPIAQRVYVPCWPVEPEA